MSGNDLDRLMSRVVTQMRKIPGWSKNAEEALSDHMGAVYCEGGIAVWVPKAPK